MSFSPAPCAAAALGSFVLAAAVLTAGAPAALAAPAKPTQPAVTAAPGAYIVTLADKPLASYAGGVSGLAATKPSHGRKVDPSSPAARRYQAYLTEQQTKAAAQVGVQPTTRFSVALNGFAASLTPDQVRRLSGSRGVVAVTKDTTRQATSETSNVDFLRLTGSTGAWNALGGKAKAGRGVVVGVIDSGVWPESKSFAGPKLGTAAPTAADPYRPYRDGSTIRMKKSDGSEFVGTCQTGEKFTAASCNTKLIGARYFGDAWLASHDDVDGTDFVSPRGADGHGTHTGSTAVGDADVAASIKGHAFGKISGVAPAAKIAVYKALWQGASAASTGGATSDILQAINAAVSDGVDVINYSVGGSSESDIVDPVQIAFLNAAAAGVFVSASAGNSGPGAATLDNTSPWVTTVAASTVAPRTATVQLGNKKSYVGVSATVFAKVGAAKLVNATAAKASAASTTDAAACAPDTLDKAKTKGRVVVCDRGLVDRVAKSAEVKRAGGVAMLLVNLSDNSLDADLHSVPSIIFNPPASAAIKAYAATSGAKATLVKGNTTSSSIPYPQVAGFSSRGPSAANEGDVLKPDIAAPGVSQLASVSPTETGESFAFESGTSMAAPQIAGLAALYLSRYPTMAPMTIKSAMMTTATPTKTATGKASTDAYAQGAGNVRPDRMFSPGVTFDSGIADWLGYLEARGIDTESGVAPIAGVDLNTPSIAVGNLLGTQTVTRRLTAVKPGVYRAAVSVPGFRATVSPSSLTFASVGETKTVKLTFTRTTAAFGDAAFGKLSLAGPGVGVTAPIALTPQLIDAPDEVDGSGTSGSKTYSVRTGVTADFTARAYGLTASQRSKGTVTASDAGVTGDYDVTVPAGAKVARFQATSDNSAADIDLYVYRVVDGDFEPVGTSATGSGDETVVLRAPEAGHYVASVEAFADAPGTSSSSYTLTSGVVPNANAGNLTVVPPSQPATAGGSVEVTAGWSGLDAGVPYLGYIQYADGSGTVVRVN